jgi:hypothetical protein
MPAQTIKEPSAVIMTAHGGDELFHFCFRRIVGMSFDEYSYKPITHRNYLKKSQFLIILEKSIVFSIYV